MSQFFRIHPDNPQPRLINQAVQIIKDGGLVALPTDSSYALACHLDDKDAVERLRRIRGIDDKQLLSLLVRDLSELSNFAQVDNRQYRLIKSVTPGPYVFVLQATKEVPRRLSHPSRKTIGLRVPDHTITLDLLEALGEPLLASTLILPPDTEPLNDPEEIRERLEKQIELVIDAGACPAEPSTVIDLSGGEPVLVRAGRGALEPFGLTA
ncbi:MULTISPECIES: L-threonylcarbamoyladenylate synthase [unclassified Caballeronia]|uniref:L-threonylcarbamoyladenylate synthase n=1 Tax=unclassified Caballeronia TaxID=2646786 RepID=UPI0028663EA8|nr:MULTISPECIES: L-threonylcarbamoyladenylate synthase [unclassified Caballeronia]MDR5813866.1 L-threonylcarbamoyladenylate synthase [Caballeronia sp. LZ033]MDR5823510.1 L-threonylcarbamoyladenylate synthase [Caballeronia sp. LZ043]MDR5834309.1 L-threonylcarbamoyladenylate synthase [Caballeronia sp. LZ034LL]MDR5878410.1 L-threonylcarbamoyladenylate synthase [Caballeronia sp. LZ032]